jgi:hypothetical protein
MLVAFILCALLATSIAILAYINWLRVLGYLPEEERDFDAVYKWLWFGVFFWFVIGLGLILV